MNICLNLDRACKLHHRTSAKKLFSIHELPKILFHLTILFMLHCIWCSSYMNCGTQIYKRQRWLSVQSQRLALTTIVSKRFFVGFGCREAMFPVRIEFRKMTAISDSVFAQCNLLNKISNLDFFLPYIYWPEWWSRINHEVNVVLAFLPLPQKNHAGNQVLHKTTNKTVVVSINLATVRKPVGFGSSYCICDLGNSSNPGTNSDNVRCELTLFNKINLEHAFSMRIRMGTPSRRTARPPLLHRYSEL